MKLKKVSGYWMIEDGVVGTRVSSTVSWPRVVEALKAAGIVREYEDVVGLDCEPTGLTFSVEKRE